MQRTDDAVKTLSLVQKETKVIETAVILARFQHLPIVAYSFITSLTLIKVEAKWILYGSAGDHKMFHFFGLYTHSQKIVLRGCFLFRCFQTRPNIFTE